MHDASVPAEYNQSVPEEGLAMDRLADLSNIRLIRAPGSAWRVVLPLLAALCLCQLSGCQIVIGVLQIFQGFPKTTCDFSKMTNRKLTEKGKKVIVLSTCSAGALSEEPSLDLDVIAEVSRRLKIENVRIVAPHKVATWIDDHGGITKDTDLEPIGTHFKADFIVLFTFDSYGYREDNSPGLYRGHAAGKVVVAEMVDSEFNPKKKRAKVIYNKPFDSKYPKERPMSADQEGPDLFKRRFMGELSQTLTRLFIDYRPEDEI
jgi:hypothetical protein